LGENKGHVNHDTVDYVADKLPPLVRASLDNLLRHSPSPAPQQVSDLLADTIVQIDSAIISDFLSIFAEEDVDITTADPEYMRDFVNDGPAGGNRYVRASRMVGGTTALVTLFEEDSGNLWVANLGDCIAGEVLPVSRAPSHLPDFGLCVFGEQCLAAGMARTGPRRS
jgi:pyruvate dehydrogenase phosphatase